MKNIELSIEGMHCEGCSKRLERVLNGIDGVESASVSLEQKLATIEYSEEKVTIDTIKEAINDAGFEA